MTLSSANRSWQDEVFYQIFPRSFYDSNGDGIGDLPGLESRLDYLQELGVTALWINPLLAAPSDHKYFPSDFFRIDPEFGTNEDFFHFCDAVHARNMRVLLDMETQYVPRTHDWAERAQANPKSSERDFFFYHDKIRTHREHLSIDMGEGIFHNPNILLLNLDNPEMLSIQHSIYRYWMNPDGGQRPRGVDGYRMDHVMDDLDHKGRLTGMLGGFWKGLVEEVRRVRPDAFFLAEPADWSSHGEDILNQSGMDAVFAIRLMFAISSLKADRIREELDGIRAKMPVGKVFSTVIENHDVQRFATNVKSNPRKLRLGAVFNLLLPGLPCLYYGQEIGMVGRLRVNRQVSHDRLREGMRWTRSGQGKGMCDWYQTKSENPFPTQFQPGDGISVEEQQTDPDSLLNFYRRLIALRKERVCLRRGDLRWLETGDADVLGWERVWEDGETCDRIAVVANLSRRRRAVRLSLAGEARLLAASRSMLSDSIEVSPDGAVGMLFGPWEFAVLDVAK